MSQDIECPVCQFAGGSAEGHRGTVNQIRGTVNQIRGTVNQIRDLTKLIDKQYILNIIVLITYKAQKKIQ